MEEDPLLEVKRIREPVFRKDRHLSSALVTTEIQYLLTHRNNPKALKKEHKDLIEKLDEVNPDVQEMVHGWMAGGTDSPTV